MLFLHLPQVRSAFLSFVEIIISTHDGGPLRRSVHEAERRLGGTIKTLSRFTAFAREEVGRMSAALCRSSLKVSQLNVRAVSLAPTLALRFHLIHVHLEIGSKPVEFARATYEECFQLSSNATAGTDGHARSHDQAGADSIPALRLVADVDRVVDE
eukprot:3368336-Pleurochrysis_carterae.AAC.1